MYVNETWVGVDTAKRHLDNDLSRETGMSHISMGGEASGQVRTPSQCHVFARRP